MDYTKEIQVLKELLKLLRKDQKMLTKLEIGKIHSDESFENGYRDWLWLLSKLDDPIEADFFRTSWVPLCFDEYFFIDVSKENWVIFTCEYNWRGKTRKTHYWYQEHLFIDLADLLENIGDFDYLKYRRNQNRDPLKNKIDDWFDSLP